MIGRKLNNTIKREKVEGRREDIGKEEIYGLNERGGMEKV